MFRTLACRLLVMFCVAFAIDGQTTHPDLSGTWQIDVARSTEGITPLPSDPDTPRPPAPPPGMAWKAFSPEILTHNEPELKIQIGSTKDALQLSTDGQENVNPMANGRVHKSTSRWDGDTLVTRWRLEQNGSQFTEGSDVRVIAQGGQVLIDDRTTRTPWAEAKYHMVWVRKP
jgi:hypothetical protein